MGVALGVIAAPERGNDGGVAGVGVEVGWGRFPLGSGNDGV